MDKREHLILTIAGGLCLLAVLSLGIVQYLNQRQAVKLVTAQAILNQNGPALEQELRAVATEIGERSATNPKMKELLGKYNLQYTPPAKDTKGAAR
jgi:hypothetical protein